MRTSVIYFLSVILVAIASPLQAGSVTVPNTFSSGTPAVAAEVNGNFTAVKTAVDDNNSRITNIETAPATGLNALSCTSGEIAQWNGSAWTCVNTNSCDTGFANDVMVEVGSWCVDKYESSICDTRDGTGTCWFANGLSTDGSYPDAANLPTSFNRDGSGSTPVYAVSKPGVTPARGMTWYQASVACAMSGKQIIPDDVWQLAAIGTIDPNTASGTGGLTGGSQTDATNAQCNINSGSGTSGGTWQDATTGVRPTSRAGTTPGGSNACLSRFGVEDMIGNLWERTATNGVLIGSAGFVSIQAFGTTDPVVSTTGAIVYNGTSNTTVTGAPAGVMRGGSYIDTTNAGLYHTYTAWHGSASQLNVGFRCARPK